LSNALQFKFDSLEFLEKSWKIVVQREVVVLLTVFSELIDLSGISIILIAKSLLANSELDTTF
jgi:hypothetical protein